MSICQLFFGVLLFSGQKITASFQGKAALGLGTSKLIVGDLLSHQWRELSKGLDVGLIWALWKWPFGEFTDKT